MHWGNPLDERLLLKHFKFLHDCSQCLLCNIAEKKCLLIPFSSLSCSAATLCPCFNTLSFMLQSPSVAHHSSLLPTQSMVHLTTCIVFPRWSLLLGPLEQNIAWEKTLSPAVLILMPGNGSSLPQGSKSFAVFLVPHSLVLQLLSQLLVHLSTCDLIWVLILTTDRGCIYMCPIFTVRTSGCINSLFYESC